MSTAYTTRDDCIAHEIVAALREHVWDYDVRAIADAVITSEAHGAEMRYSIRDDVDFWAIVEENRIS